MIDMSIIDDPTLTELALYWDAKRGGRSAPSRDDLDPVEIPHLLYCMGLIDVLENGTCFRYRLVGTKVASAFGKDPTHSRLGDTFSRHDPYAYYIRDILRQTADEVMPRYTATEYVREDGTRVRAKRLTMPLVDDYGRSNILLVGTVFSEKTKAPVLPPHCVTFRGLMDVPLEAVVAKAV